MLFCHQTTDIAREFIILNQRQMGAEDSFAFAVTLTQLLVQLLGKRCGLCSSRVESCALAGIAR